MDYVFIFDSYYLEELRQMQVKRAYCLPLACSPSTHKKIMLSDGDLGYFGSDVAFAGFANQSREETLKAISGFNVKVWGPAWSFDTYNKVRIMSKQVTAEEVASIYNASKIILNINHPQSIFGTNMRTFEAAGCQAFQLSDYRQQLSELFDIGSEIICYNDLEDLRDKIKYYLLHSSEREEIARRGQARVYRDHTYKARMQEMLKIIGKSF
jgi:spore maturation protein CgeB